MRNNRIIDIAQFYDENIGKINRLLLKTSIEGLSKFEKLLPNQEEIESEDIFRSWRFNYLMCYFMGMIVADDLEKLNDEDNYSYNDYIDFIRYRMYVNFFKENYSKEIIYTQEFFQFSKLLNETIVHDNDLLSEEFKEKIKKAIEVNPSIDNTRVLFDILRELKNKKYEFDKNKLKLVIGRIKSIKLDFLDEESNKIESENKRLGLTKKED